MFGDEFEGAAKACCDLDDDGNPSSQDERFFLASIAISLKRIADAIDRHNEPRVRL